MSWETAGKVKVTVNNNTVTGTGTMFGAKCRVGDAFIGPDNGFYEIQNIVSDTVLTLAKPYKGATVAAGDYSVMPVRGYQKLAADRLYALMGQLEAATDITGQINSVLDAINGETV